LGLMKNSWQVATAAEAFAAAQFARCGWDVSVQYGANQPEYDLVAVDGDRVLKVSVKGSKDGSWGLTQTLLRDANYHAAADKWLQKHSSKTVFCLVQFKDVSTESLPRMYLATPQEICARLKSSVAGRGDTILHEHHVWGARAHGAGTVDKIPDHWKFTAQRLEVIAHEAQPVLAADAPQAARR
jgi:Holliday junction resolvase-like predicted endonuclease